MTGLCQWDSTSNKKGVSVYALSTPYGVGDRESGTLHGKPGAL